MDDSWHEHDEFDEDPHDNDVREDMNGEHMHDEDPHDENGHHGATSILGVPDFNGDGNVDNADVRDIIARYEAVDGDDLYHPLYDTNANGEIDNYDIENVIHALGEDVPLLDQHIAQATQATMQYYGSGGLEQAIADGYVPTTQEAMGHGFHYANFDIFTETKHLEQTDITRPVGLNFDNEGNLIAVYYLREPLTQEATPDNPFGPFLIDPNDDNPPSSFDSLSSDDWHEHESSWITDTGNLDSPESVFFEEDVPVEIIASRAQQANLTFYPESDIFYSPKVWMLHGWFHSLNPNGVFANTHPEIAQYSPLELGAHGGHDGHGSEEDDSLILGTDYGEGIIGTDQSDRINGLDGDDWIQAGLGDDSVWGSHGNDWIRGDDDYSVEGGDDMLYGGPGHDLIFGNGGDDRLFGGTDNDQLVGGDGDDLLRGSLGHDILTGDAGSDSFVLAIDEGLDIITDFEIDSDLLVLYTGVSSDTISITQLDSNTALSVGDETLAILNGINADELIAAGESVLVDA